MVNKTTVPTQHPTGYAVAGNSLRLSTSNRIRVCCVAGKQARVPTSGFVAATTVALGFGLLRLAKRDRGTLDSAAKMVR